MQQKQGLYDPSFEHDACGIGFTANITGVPEHQIIKDGLTILKKLVHRGAETSDNTGDGAGILFQIPFTFFRNECENLKIKLPEDGKYGIGMFFLPLNPDQNKDAVKIIESACSENGAEILGWRKVPVNPSCIGEKAEASRPEIKQAFIKCGSLSGKELERRLYLIRKVIDGKAADAHFSIEDIYTASMSSRTIVYKGMFVAEQLESFFDDLSNADFKSAFAIVHQRYSTNTFPSWILAQPFRCIAHNGEINTLKGNLNRMRAREPNLYSEEFGDDLKKLLPVTNNSLSDSANFDSVLELLMSSGRSIEHSAMMMMPEAFGQTYHISQDRRAFYEYHSAIMAPWDGPAAIVFTDGEKIGASLDRNGLRPARWTLTKSGRFVLASESGVLDFPPEEILKHGRLAPGKMLLVDMLKNRVKYDNEIKSEISRSQPYRRWLDENRIELRGLFQVPEITQSEPGTVKKYQKVFGISHEELTKVIAPMAASGKEPLSSMGNDEALAILSTRPSLLFDYFKQLFAQVTNPPIDPYRENLVMSLMSFIGREGNLLTESEEHCHQLKLQHPILSNDDIIRLKAIDLHGMSSAVINSVFPAGSGGTGLEEALNRICSEAIEQVKAGKTFIILSDRNINAENAPIPSLLAVSAVHHALVDAKLRQIAGLFIETGEARDVMHMALLLGYGVSAINPYLVFDSLPELQEEGSINPDMKLENAAENYIAACKTGILKVMSKMGVSTLRSYRGSQLFEAIGLEDRFIENYFAGTASRIGGIGLDKIAADVLERHETVFSETAKLNEGIIPPGGKLHYRRFSEKHLMTPEAVVNMQRAARTGDHEAYKRFSSDINNTSEKLCTLRSLFRFKEAEAIDIDEVEPASEIVKRFVSSAMSLGSISREAHETLAIAMNRLGAMSNSGEGGENIERYTPLENGDSLNGKVKQIASARFGVNSNYLSKAQELQIKIAQGAKPGEGGQLPGYKVDEFIGRNRHANPGTTLISPPPHHDIYSIEDLAQLIYDLKCGNPEARVSVKLVSEAGVGTIAAGVAKGKADMILISGGDGGTGASPISSIKYAGMPWELGLAETQQTLVMNGLRKNVRLQTDGQMRTGRDIVIAALLGAEEFGFGTASLVTLGCVMMRKCHKNTCPVGVATQDPELRKRFSGKPEHMINYMMFVAEETREIMASLGFHSINEMVGRTDRLEMNDAIDRWKERGIDLSAILYRPEAASREEFLCTADNKINLDSHLDATLIKEASDVIQKKKKSVIIKSSIKNTDRSVGATLSCRVSNEHAHKGLPDKSINCQFSGHAGQSFGAFLAPGISFELSGTANDYLGKGLSGGQIVVYPPEGSLFRSQNNIITGNVNLFGATGGEVFISGMAGERFAVRNSGVTAVVEGVGDHACEYMTGGKIVVLGKTGLNFAAGMSGGVAYVLDEDQLFDTKCNLEMVNVEPISDSGELEELRNLIEKHIKLTGSKYAARILDDWTEMSPAFVRVIPLRSNK
ncbi:MAG: glutamate synthase large subunit [Spirochaetales bacterium]|uniref:Glutamate synthase [NADPH] large chain n=1 Tax=Candidatus Thalassospirochaeta sargassi TaxID=3119039 RepID=A0AAJ1IFE3_9SPIO|nr:glutamate synthase large subunit [Spirochaetales bacterium]